MAQRAKVISISLPVGEDRELVKLARQERRTKSELVRMALRRYQLRRQWERVKEYGAQKAVELGIASYDDVDRIAGKR